MNLSNGLVTALNKMREMSVSEGSIYHQYVPVITDLTSIGEFGTPILEYTDVRNEFMTKLVKRIVETQIEVKYSITNFRNSKVNKYHLVTLFKIFTSTRPRVASSTLKILPVYFKNTRQTLNNSSSLSTWICNILLRLLAPN